MSDDNPQPLIPRSVIRQHIPGHSDAMQQDMQLWQHLSMSQPQPATGVQAVPVGIGFANRPQQQLWPDHSSQFSQRSWQPLPQQHTQQSPQESQEMNPQVVRSQHQQNWQGAGDVNSLQLQQLQHVIWLQQQQQQQQQMQLQQHHHQTEPSLHHMDVLGQHDDLSHDKFTKSPSPQVEETRHSPLNRSYVQNVTSPQQQLWQHPQMVHHQYDVQHSESPHSQAYQQTPTVSHHQPLFTHQQQYVQPVWQHAPYSQVQLQHLRQSTPPMQQHMLWQQQQQQQQQQQMHQLHQQTQQMHTQNSDSVPAYSPPSSSHFSEKNTLPEKKDDLRTEQSSSFLGSRISMESVTSNSSKIKPFDSPAKSMSSTGLSSAASPLSVSNTVPAVTTTVSQIRILSKPIQSTQSSDIFVPQNQKTTDSFPSMMSSSSPLSLNQRPTSQGGLFNLNNVNMPPPQRPQSQSFNPNPHNSPYQNLNNSQTGTNKNFTGLYGSPNRFQAPNKDIGSSGNQFRPRSPHISNHQQSNFGSGMLQRGPNLQSQSPVFNRLDRVEVNLFVSGLNPRTNGDSVRHYFESVVRPVEVKDHVLFGIDHTDALITFLQKPDVHRIKQHVRSRKLDGFSLEVCEVPPPRAIVVSSDVPVRSVDLLVNYFEKESIGGGPMKKNGVDETDDGCCILEFEDYRVIQRLCAPQRSHRVDGILLRVSPYFRCEIGAVWDTGLHMVPVPKPVNIQILPDQLEFVKRQCQAQFSTRMREKFAEVTYSKDHVTVKCTLRQTMHNYRILVRGWETGVQEAVAKFLGETIDQADVVIPDLIWDRFIEWLNSGKAESKDLLVKQDRDRKHIKLVGSKVNLKRTNQLISQKVEALARAARRKIEVRKVKSAEKLLVLELQGSIGAICKKYVDLKIRVDGNEVTLEGDPTDIPNAFKDIYTECDKVEPFTFKHSFSREFVQFCKKEASRKQVQRKLDQKLIKGAWNITGSDVSVYTHRKLESEAINKILRETLKEESIQVDKTSTSLLNSEVWGDFASDKTRRYKDRVEIYVRKQQLVLVVGMSEVIPNVAQLIKEFLDEKTVKTVLVSCDSVVLEFIAACWTEKDFDDIQKCDVSVKKKVNGLELTGLAEKLIAGKQKLDTKLKRLCCKKHPIKKIGIYEVMDALRTSRTISVLERSCKCVIKLPQDLEQNTLRMANHFEAVDSAHTSDETGSSHGAKVFHTLHHKIRVQIVQGEIGSQKTDAVVCNAAANLNLKSGSASYSLVKAGGNQLQVDCNRLYPSGIKDGDVAVIDGGNLSCDQVYLTSLPGWRDAAHNRGKVYRNIVRECLRLANSSDKKSLSFPAMGSGGFLGYPRDVVASIVYGAVVEFDASYSNTSLKTVSIIIGNKEMDTLKAFEEQEYMRLHGSSGSGPLSSDFVKGRIRIELVTEDLAHQKVDALLCSVSTDMNLTRNAICKSLVEAGGKVLQEECKQKYKNELAAGKVVDISGASLPCKTIYLTVLPTYVDTSTGEKNMIGVLQTTFQLANLKGYQSIAIPALGTGHCSYPKNISAKCMYEAVLDWASKNPKASLKLIRFVMYSKDTEAQQAFRTCHLKIQGRESRACRSLQGDPATVNNAKAANALYRMAKHGCTIGSVQVKVICEDILSVDADVLVNPVGPNFDMSGAISQALVKQCPNILPECQQKKTELRKDGFVLTGASELKSKYLIHALNQDSLASWRTKMAAYLEEANKKSVKTIAFPLLATGTGPKSFAAENIAESLFCAVDDFTNKHPKSPLTEVQLVITSDTLTAKAAVLSAFQERVTFALSPPTSSRWLKRGPMERSGSNSNQHSAWARHKAMSDMSVVVHSDAIINIDRCIRALDDKVALEYCRKSVEAETTAIKSLSDKQIDNILDSQLVLDVKLDRKSGKFSVHGPFRSVLTAMDTIHTRLQVYSNEQKHKAEAETLACQLRWHYEECGALEKKEIPYDLMINLVIEKAFLAGKTSFELVDTERKVYVIDFQKLIEYPKDNKSDIVRVVRKDIVKVGDVPVPSNWMSMSNNENVKKVTLATNDREYQKVEKQLLSQLRSGLYTSKMKNKQNIQVVKIERIQNRSVHQLYAAKKKLMEQQRTGKQVERQLWHCSSEENLASIVAHGFNRSYCGTNGVLYGQGVYFAVDASYSVQPYISGSKPGTRRHMFLVKTLTGEVMKGNPTLRVLPPVNPSQPNVLYDSAADDVNKPAEFVLFHDAQAYPEYLITFNM